MISTLRTPAHDGARGQDGRHQEPRRERPGHRPHRTRGGRPERRRSGECRSHERSSPKSRTPGVDSGGSANLERVQAGRDVTASIETVGRDKYVYINTAVPAVSALHQLQAPPADFTGRADDLTALRSALPQAGSLAIFGLRGTGGVGKTTLALKLAEELTSRYPDAQIYLDLKGVDPQPLTAAQAMAHVVRSFQPEVRIPENETELAGLYRSLLHGKRALLLMDNAANKEQVEPLTPPSGSLLLVTSRFHFVLPGMFPRNLDELPEKEACDLLLAIAARINDKAGEIARLCGCLPLALRLAGSALAERADLSPSEYIRRLREGKERFGEVEASLDLSYQLLADEPRRLWRMLAVFPGTFNAEAAAAVWETEVDLAHGKLSDFVRSSLVEWEDKERRYRLHDLSRKFAKVLLNFEKNLVAKRHANHFLEVLRQADNLYTKGGQESFQGLSLFDNEWNNIQIGQAWAAARFQQDREAAAVCSKYPSYGAHCLEFRQDPKERIYWMEAALTASRHIGDRNAEAMHVGNLGLAYWALGETRRAIKFHKQALIISREIGNRRGESIALANLGLAYADLGQPRRAIKFYENYLAISREIGESRGVGTIFNNLGSAYADLDNYQLAIELYQKALHISQEIGDRRGEGNSLGNLGNVYASLGDTRHAIEFYEQALDIDREIGDRRGECIDSWNLGNELEKLGDLMKAADLMQIRADYEREIGHPDAEKHTAYIESLRARLAAQDSNPKQ